MRAVDAYSNLLDFGLPAIETREAAARLKTSVTNTSRILRGLHDAGLIRQLRRGVWALKSDLDPVEAAPYLTAPFPAYVSMWSALALHEMIEQIPRSTYVVTLGRSAKFDTPVGHFSNHHIVPELFGGFAQQPAGGSVASPEKAVFDVVYLSAPSGGTTRLPELDLPRDFDASVLEEWVERVPRPRLRTLVRRGVARALAG